LATRTPKYKPPAAARFNATRLHHCLVAVDPAIVRGRHDHPIFAAHLIGEGESPEFILHAADDVEIGYAGFAGARTHEESDDELDKRNCCVNGWVLRFKM